MSESGPKRGSLETPLGNISNGHVPSSWDQWASLLIGSALEFAIFAMDTSGRITHWGPGAQKMIGYTSQEVIGREGKLIFTARDQAQGQAEQEILQAMQDGFALDDRWHVRKDGSQFWAAGMMFLLRDAEGKHVGFGKIFQDKTDQKIEMENLRDGIRARDEFVAMLSHELRSPLMALRLNLATLTQSVSKQGISQESQVHVQRLVGSLSRQMNRLGRLVDDVFNVAALDSTEIQIRKELVNLNEILSNLVQEYDGEIKNWGCNIQLEINEQVHGFWDRVRLEQVFSNLMLNACKFGAGKPVRIRVRSHEGFACISFEDQGTGIPVEDQVLIFERFSRSKLHSSQQGLGLGLYIARQIAEAHEGRILLHSELGKGARFTVELPLNSESASS